MQSVSTLLYFCTVQCSPETLVDKYIWYHMMAIAVPDVILHEAAMVWIEGGSNGPGTGPAGPDDELVTLTVIIAEQIGCIGAYVLQVPNQRITFTVSLVASSARMLFVG